MVFADVKVALTNVTIKRSWV